MFTQKQKRGTSLVAQWLGIRLPVQGTRVRALVQEDPTCQGATKPVRRNYWACALEPASHNYWARVPQLLKPTRLEPVVCNKRNHPMGSPQTAMKSSPRSPQLAKARTQQQRPKTAKNLKKINKFNNKKKKAEEESDSAMLFWINEYIITSNNSEC